MSELNYTHELYKSMTPTERTRALRDATTIYGMCESTSINEPGARETGRLLMAEYKRKKAQKDQNAPAQFASLFARYKQLLDTANYGQKNLYQNLWGDEGLTIAILEIRIWTLDKSYQFSR